MDYPHDPPLVNLISICGRGSIASQEYIKRLGLPLAKDSEGTRGHAKFDDETGHVQMLYSSTLKALNWLFDTHDTVEELRNQAMSPSPEFLREVTENMLSTYGPLIWSAQEPRLTRISKEYPRFLVFDDLEDFQRLAFAPPVLTNRLLYISRIRAYLYYWILHRAIRKFDSSKKVSNNDVSHTKTSKSGQARKFGPSPRHPSSIVVQLGDSESDSSSEYEDPVSHRSKRQQVIRSRLDHRIDSSSHGVARSISSPQVPVAQMLPLSNNVAATPTAYFQPRTPTVDPFTSQQETLREEIENTNGDTTSTTTTVKPHSIGKIRRRDVSCPDKPTTQEHTSRKRKRPSTHQETDLRNKPSRNDEVELHLDIDRGTPHMASMYPSPLKSAGVEVVPCNFPTMSRVVGTDDGQGVTSSVHTSPIHLDETTSSREEPNQLLNRGNEQDNSQNPAEGPPVTSQLSTKSNHQGKRPSLVVVLKLSHKGTVEELPIRTPTSTMAARQTTIVTKQSRYNRRLASMLLDLLEACNPEHQDLTALEEIVTLINKIRNDEVPRTGNTGSDALDKHQTILLQWLQCVEAFIAFRKVTGFKGDKSERASFVRGLSREMKRAARGPLLRISSAISEWRQEPDFTLERFSKDLADVLFEMTTWMDMMEVEELGEDLMKFNERLFAWFD
ncbi:Nn.00g048200.m01.CDS01 [Neocucurbitaria sp. VM-36]